jgi:hypothetical protein
LQHSQALKEDYLNFVNFKVKNFIKRKDPEKKLNLLKDQGSQNGFLRFWADCCECNKFLDFLKLFVTMRLAISFVGVQISYFLDLQIKSYGCLKFFGRVRAVKKLLFFNFVGLDFFS